MGPIIVPPGGHSVPSTPPVVTIAPTKTVNGVWRSESRQVSGGADGGSSHAETRFPPRERGQQLPRGSVCHENTQGSWSGLAWRAPQSGVRTDML